MIEPKEFYDFLIEKTGTDFFSGVPDSTIKDFTSYISDHSSNHTIATSEGSAISMAIGHHLATGKVPMVYMQNSGIGNALNPILSMASREIYKIPMIIFVGWRGENRDSDEPQHIHQGKVMIPSFGAMELDYDLMPTSINSAKALISTVLSKLKADPKPYFIILKKRTFKPYKGEGSKVKNSLIRYEVIKSLKENSDDFFIGTTGFTARELFTVSNNSQKDFLSIGGMGHCGSIALGLAKAKPNKNFTILDGDGSLLMHLGTMASLGFSNLENITHICFNNEAHQSVGAQKTLGDKVSFTKLAKLFGYKKSLLIENLDDFNHFLEEKENFPKPLFVEIKTSLDTLTDLKRPTLTPKEIKKQFMERLRD